VTVLDGPLPTSVEIGGREAPVNSDYRVCLRILEAFEDDALADAEKQAVMLSLLYPAIPADRAEACRRAVWFLNGGEEDGGQAADAAGPRRYSFTKDARFIFTAILQTHGIDVERAEYLHWWKFCYLFMDLREDCFFSRLIYYRTQRDKGRLTPQEREYCASIRHLLDLPRPAADTAAEDKFMRLLRGGNG
jgi:bacteriophage gp15 protein